MNPLLKYAETPPFAELGYKPQTTYWGDFGVADVFVLNGQEPDAVQDTFNRAYAQSKDDREYGTELAMVLNHKAWEHYDKGNARLSVLYVKLYNKLDRYILDNWKGEDRDYYQRVTD